jgi:LAS superfamily LD-carboxypeptidase LdcB
LIKCAQVGTSEHQAWLAVDIKVITKWGRWYSLDVNYPNKYLDWLRDNASIFWFHNTYQKGVEIDGKIVEWRHRRYLWTELAKILSDNKQTLSEYYNWIHE